MPRIVSQHFRNVNLTRNAREPLKCRNFASSGRIVRDSEKGSARVPGAVLVPSLDEKRATH